MPDQQVIPAPSNPFTLLERAMEKGVDAEQLERLTLLYERWQSNRAVEEYGRALAKFQANCPPVVKGREVKNKNNSTRYKFAGYEDVMATARPHLIAAGLSVSFFTPADATDQFTVVCRLQVGSHYVDHPFTGPRPDLAEIAKFMFITQPQAYGLILSYWKRYAFCAAAGVVVTDEDNDCAPVDAVVGSDEVKQINELIDECREAGKPVDMDKFLAWLGVESLDRLTMKGFAKAVWELRRKKKGKAKEAVK